MKLEVAKNVLHNIRAKNIQASSCSLADQEDKRNWGEEIEAIDVILEELSKKDKVINEMALHIKDNYFMKGCITFGTPVEKLKKYFYKKVEEQE